ncbi:hypothetical protein ACLB2K_054161 [Fragaria x ananassa]
MVGTMFYFFGLNLCALRTKQIDDPIDGHLHAIHTSGDHDTHMKGAYGVPIYAVAQLTGSISASFTLSILLHPIKHVGTTSPSGSDIQALIVEIVMTFCMMFITSAVATDTKAIGELAGIAVGSAVCITSIFAGPISGGSMNPARTLGPALASSYYKGIWVYVVGPVTGTLLGAWSYNFIRVTDKPIQAISPRSFSLKLRRMKSDNERQVVTCKNPHDSA